MKSTVLNTYKSSLSFVFIFLYVFMGVVSRLELNENLYYLIISLALATILIIAELLYSTFKNNKELGKKNAVWFSIQILLLVGLIGVCYLNTI